MFDKGRSTLAAVGLGALLLGVPVQAQPVDYVFEFSLDIGSDAELSDPFRNGNEGFDPGDVYWWQGPPVNAPGRDGFKDDLFMFAADPWPDAPDAGYVTVVPVGTGGIEGYSNYFDLDGHDQLADDLYGLQFIPPNQPLQNPIPQWDSPCIYGAEYLMISYDDDMAPGWPASDVPVTAPSPGGVSSYGSGLGQDEILGLVLWITGTPPPYPLVGAYPIGYELAIHQSLVPNADYAEAEDDDVDSLDVVHPNGPCAFWYFSADQEGHLGLDPGGIYELTTWGPMKIVDEFIHLGIPEDTDIDAFEFAWLEDPQQPGVFCFAVLFSVDEDDPLTPWDESGTLPPNVVFGSFLTGSSFPVLEEGLSDDIDALTCWPEPVQTAPPVGACCLDECECRVLTEADCATFGGAWHGTGTDCSDIDGNGVGDLCFTCDGDTNCDGLINLGDLAQLLGNYGMTTGAEFTDGDMDGDGDVDLADLAAVLGQYGTTCWGACCVEDEYGVDQCVATNTEDECSAIDGRWFEGEDCFADPPFECPDTVTIEILTDDYGWDTEWELVERTTGTVVASEWGLEDNELYRWHVPVDGSLCYDWIIFDEEGDGICCDHGYGYYRVYYNDELLCVGGEFGGRATCANVTGACPPGCVHSVALYDDGGDGWNGCTLDVLVNAVVVLDDITLESGSGPETYPFFAEEADSITTEFTAVSSEEECSYRVYDGDGTEICADGLGGTEPVGCTCMGYCPPVIIDIWIQTDDYPDETTWELFERDVGVIASGGPYEHSGWLYHSEVEVDPAGCYDFAIYDAYGDGICCDEGDGWYWVAYDGAGFCEGGEFGYEDYCLGMGNGCPPPPDGACCVDFDCVATTTEWDCFVHWGGLWYEGEDCFGDPPFECPDTVTIVILTDDYGEDTAWELVERTSGTVVASEYGPLEDNELYRWYVPVDASLCYDWTIYDDEGDGICCYAGDGYYEVYYNDELVCEGGEFEDEDRCWGIGAGCVDFVVEAPFTSELLSTCGAGDHCALRDTEEHEYEVIIPHAGVWSFNTCLYDDPNTALDTYIFLGTSLCSEDLGYNDDACGVDDYQSEIIVNLEAGHYFCTVEGYSGCDNYIFDVHEIPRTFLVEAPYTSPIRTTCGAGYDCDMEPDSPDHEYEVIIPYAGVWNFNTCLHSDLDTMIFVGTTLCSEDIGSNDDTDGCGDDYQSEVIAYLEPGNYFCTIEHYCCDSCGEYIFDVHEVVFGACCVDSDCVATNTGTECDDLGGTFFEGETCPEFVCPCIYCRLCFTDCGPAGPDCPDPTDTPDDWITNVTFNTIDNDTYGEGCPCSYGDYSDVSTTVGQGNTYTLSVTFCSEGNYVEHVSAWFDWNHNCVFEESERYYLGGGIDATLSAEVTVPLTALLGPTGMRVIERYDSEPNDPCEEYYYGEAEDYTVIVGEHQPTYGACCDDFSGVCEDTLEQLYCDGRFAADTLCAELDPPCGTLGACCVDGVCVATDTETGCDATGGLWFIDETCPEFECPLADFVVEAPYTSPLRDACGSDDCMLRPYDEHTYYVVIPYASIWNFNTCLDDSWDTYIFLGTSACSQDIGSNDDTDGCGDGLQSQIVVELEAGNYFCTVEGYDECDIYIFDVHESTGACCVDEVCMATTTKSECDDLGGTFYLGQSCDDFVCPEPCPESQIDIMILTDYYPSETTWEVTDFYTGQVLCSGGPYDQQWTYYFEQCCIAYEDCVNFTIYDSYGDGIDEPGGYTVSVDGEVICDAMGGRFTGSSATCEMLGGGCPWPEGACCVDWVCTATNTEPECDDLGGSFFEGETCPEFACPQTYADFLVEAPYTSELRSTCGAGDDCALRDTEEHEYEVIIPHAGLWNFNTCLDLSFDTYIFLGTAQCAQDLGYKDDSCGWQSEIVVELEAGNYFCTVEGYGCGDYIFDVRESLPGACCVDRVCVATTTEPECDVLGGGFHESETCPEFSCPDGDMGAKAPFTSGELSTAGRGNDCPLYPAEDDEFLVIIPHAGLWSFNTCLYDDPHTALDTFIYLGTSLCSNDLGTNSDACGVWGLQSEIIVELEAGLYFCTVEGYDGWGDYVLDVHEVAP